MEGIVLSPPHGMSRKRQAKPALFAPMRRGASPTVAGVKEDRPTISAPRRTRAATRWGAVLAATGAAGWLVAAPGTAAASDAAWARAQQAGVPAAAWQHALALAREQAEAQAPAGARIEVQPGLLDVRLRLAPCAQVQAQAVPGAPWSGRTRVALHCAEAPAGHRPWRVHLPMTVQVWAPAFVLRQALPAGTALGAEHLAVAEAAWQPGLQHTLGPDAATPPWGRLLARPLPAGTPLRAADLQQRRWFGSGEPVRVLVQGPGFAVVAQGQALGDGIEGRPARVRLDSGRVLTGQPVGEQQVRVVL
jgi:flagella basal body P-ring formation protein FlgA